MYEGQIGRTGGRKHGLRGYAIGPDFASHISDMWDMM